jgi:hypothetical protein
MTTTTLTAAPGHCSVTPHGGVAEAADVTGPPTGSAHWVDPGTDQVYPLSYRAYRQAREAEERMPSRHRTLGPDVDYNVWRRGLSPGAPEAEVSLNVRPNAPPRIRRMIAEVLRSIRRGQPAAEAIRDVSRRFGLAQSRVRAFITASIDFQVQPPPDAIASFSGAQSVARFHAWSPFAGGGV